MAIESLQEPKSAPQLSPKSEAKFPAYNLLDSLHVADTIQKQGGGSASPEHLASYLGYRSLNNGAFLARMSAARAFGFALKNGNVLVPSPLARQILSPVYDTDAKKALVEAFHPGIPDYRQRDSAPEPTTPRGGTRRRRRRR